MGFASLALMISMSEKIWPLVSVIVLSYNGKHFLKRCLASLLATDYPNLETILIDNASTDGCIEEAEREFGSRLTRVIRNEKNLGFAEGNNVAVRLARGEYIIFLNQDTEVDPEWIKELVSVMQADSSIGAAQSKLLLLDKHAYFDSAGDFIDPYGWGLCRGGTLNEKDNGQYDQVSEIFSARGAAMIVKRSILAETDAFDPRFFLSCEDIDLCWRIRLRSYRIVFVPKSIVYHFGSPTSLSEISTFRLFHQTKNWLTMVFTNYNLNNWIKYNPAPLLISNMMLDLLERRPETMLSRAKAVIWSLTNFPYIWRRRLEIQRKVRKCPDHQIMKHMLKSDLPSYFRLFRASRGFRYRVSKAFLRKNQV